MFPEERRREIVTILNNHGRCLVGNLARELDVSEVTIRQDLDVLEREGLLRRTHGGAILNSKIAFERPFQIEETSWKAEKERIAEAAVKLISPGDTLILDVGTTVTAVARKLAEQQKAVTVFTNSLNVAMTLEANTYITTIVTGGTLRAKQHSLVNPFGEYLLKRINVDTAFIGATGIEVGHGVTNVNAAESEIKALFIKVAHRSVLLADSSKIGNVTLAKVADIEEIDLLISDKQADPEEIARLQERGLEVQLV
jgi:DeoR family transcriptional regulator of aga operon